MDINPATRGHALVVPREHTTDLMEIPDEDPRAHDARDAPARPRIEGDALPDGFNILELLLRRLGLADGLSLPRPRGPALRGRPAEASLDPREGDMEKIAAVAEEIIRGGGWSRPSVSAARARSPSSPWSNPPLNLFTASSWREP